jgi:hypothetical protein
MAGVSHRAVAQGQLAKFPEVSGDFSLKMKTTGAESKPAFAQRKFYPA